MNQGILIVNFGGPRTLEEIEPFLTSLLLDRDVVRTRLPHVFHNYLFRKIAKKRSTKVSAEYEKIGGRSPIFTDTEYIARQLRKLCDLPIYTFHRYLPATHKRSLDKLEESSCSRLLVFPMFPQFTYATTGSCARFLQQRLSSETSKKLRWIKSYPSHPAYIELQQKMIREFLAEKNLTEEEVFFLFSAHGVPQSFVDEGDLYQEECQRSFESVMSAFPTAASLLAFQSKFGPGEWLRPYTSDVSANIARYAGGRKHVLFVPISFTSDHIETLVEIEEEYMKPVKEQGLLAHRLSAFNRRSDWVKTIETILAQANPLTTEMLVRSK